MLNLVKLVSALCMHLYEFCVTWIILYWIQKFKSFHARLFKYLIVIIYNKVPRWYIGVFWSRSISFLHPPEYRVAHKNINNKKKLVLEFSEGMNKCEKERERERERERETRLLTYEVTQRSIFVWHVYNEPRWIFLSVRLRVFAAYLFVSASPSPRSVLFNCKNN